MSEKEFVPSRYNFITNSLFDNIYVIYNTLSGSLRSVKEKELEQLSQPLQSDGFTLAEYGESKEAITSMAEHGFFVEKGTDELKIVHDRYWRPKKNELRRGLNITVALTTSCNLGCTYCFQDHSPRSFSDLDIQRLSNHIESTLVENTYLGVLWFGGEPLTQFESLLKISDALKAIAKKKNCDYSEEIITNGVLLTRDKAQVLSDRGDLRNVQITVDGPKAIHDQRRVTVNGAPTFDLIWKNVLGAMDLLNISVRINVDRTNAKHIPGFLNEVKKQGAHQKISVSLGYVKPFTEACSTVEDTALSLDEFAKVEAEFILTLIREGFVHVPGLPKPGSGPFCSADKTRVSVFSPNGLVFRCWNEATLAADGASAGLKSPGELTQSDAMKKNDERWSAYDPFVHAECASCLVLPLCRGGCPWEARKRPANESGSCMSIKKNIADRVRLHHLHQTMMGFAAEKVNSQQIHNPEAVGGCNQ